MSYLLKHHKHPYHIQHGESLFSVDDLKAAHHSFLGVASQTVWISTGLLLELLAIRFMAAFLGANPSNTFFHLIYASSQPVVTPFVNVLHKIYPSGNFYNFEAYTLLSIIFYAIIGYGTAKAITAHETHLDNDN